MNKPIHQGPDQLFPSNQNVAWLANQAVRMRADDKDIASDPPVSVVTAFKLVAEEFPDRIALVDSYNDVEDIYTYKRYYESVTHVAKAFIKLGLESYHGVGIIGFNSSQCIISYLGAIFAGGLAGGMHPSSSEETFSCLAGSADCNIIIVEDDELLESVLKIADDLPHLKAIIQYRGKPKGGIKKVYSWDEILEMKVDECEEEFQRRLMDMAPNKCCTLLATSGTTGKPKWAMLSHDNLLWNVKSLMLFTNENENYPPDTHVSYQTLSHVSALLFDIYWPILCKGGTVFIAKRDALKRNLAETLRKAKPTFFVGIPKVWEMIMNSFLESEINNNVFRKKCFSWAMKVSQSSIDSKFRNNKAIKAKIAKHFFLKKMAARLGFSKCRIALVGASSCKQEVLEFFLAMGIPLMECYGLSEGGFVRRLSELVSSKDPRIAEGIQKVINKANEQAAADKEVIHKWMILPKNFSVAGGEIGLTMKLKRNAINELYQKEISEFYG